MQAQARKISNSISSRKSLNNLTDAGCFFRANFKANQLIKKMSEDHKLTALQILKCFKDIESEDIHLRATKQTEISNGIHCVWVDFGGAKLGIEKNGKSVTTFMQHSEQKIYGDYIGDVSTSFIQLVYEILQSKNKNVRIDDFPGTSRRRSLREMKYQLRAKRLVKQMDSRLEDSAAKMLEAVTKSFTSNMYTVNGQVIVANRMNELNIQSSLSPIGDRASMIMNRPVNNGQEITSGIARRSAQGDFIYCCYKILLERGVGLESKSLKDFCYYYTL